MLQTTYKVKQVTNQNKATLITINTALQLILFVWVTLEITVGHLTKFWKINQFHIMIRLNNSHKHILSYLLPGFVSQQIMSILKFVKCPTKKKTWKDLCPVNKEKLFFQHCLGFITACTSSVFHMVNIPLAFNLISWFYFFSISCLVSSLWLTNQSSIDRNLISRLQLHCHSDKHLKHNCV